MIQTSLVSLVQRVADFFSATGPTVLPAVLDAAIKTVIILVVIAIATVAMRRSSAAARHLVWFLGSASLLALPLLAVSLPKWHALPNWATTSTAVSMNSASSAPTVAPAPSVQPIAPATSTRAEPVTAPADSAVRNSVPADPPVGAGRSRFYFTWQSWLLLIWMIGAAAVLVKTLFGFFSLARLRHCSTRIGDGHWEILFGGITSQFDIRRPVEILSSSRRAMPMVWGLWRIHVLLPADPTGWSPEQWRIVLLHELAHAQRCDCQTQLIAQLSCALWWFNPLVWLARWRMQIERERACDDMVLASGTKPSKYAEQLVQIAAQMPIAQFGAAAIAMARPSTLESRVAAILDPGRNRRRMATVAVAAIVIAVSVSASALAMLTSANRNQDLIRQEIPQKHFDLTPPVGFARLVDAQGAPIAGAEVRSANPKWSVVTNSNGLVAMPDFHATGSTSLFLAIHARGFLDRFDVPVTRRADGVVVPDGDVIQMDRPGRVEGHVIGPNGKPLVGMPILADLNGRHLVIDNGAHAITDSEGRFVFENVMPGVLVLKCPSESGHPWLSPVHGVGTMATIQVADGQSVRGVVFDLSNLKAVATGRVVDKNGKPFPNAIVYLLTKSTVTLNGLDGQFDTITGEAISWPSGRTTDAQGRFILTGLPTGRWYLAAIAKFGHSTVEADSDPLILSDKPTAVADLVLPVIRKAKGHIRRVQPLDGQATVLEWIDATLSGDTEGAEALVASGSPFAENASRISSLLPQIKRVTAASERSDETGSATTNWLNLGKGHRGSLTFQLIRQSNEWRIRDVVDGHRVSLIAN
jgi:beta-lactamase regulating signal transducer with metallopeptidase domain